MEPAERERDVEEREELRQKIVKDSRGILSYFWPVHPIQLFIDLLWAVLRLFQPLAPHLIPLAVFSAALPLIIFLSVSSGYLVWKSVAVGWENELFLHYGDGGLPYAEVTLSNVVVQQPYDISLHLVVPANEGNYALGNFMANLVLSTPANSTIAAVRKPAIVLPPYATPWSYFYNIPGTIDISIPMLSDFVVGTSRALARVELGRRDQWKTLGEGHGRELAVLSGKLRGVVIHHGARGLLSRFPVISALVASGIFFFILFIGLVACLMPAVEWHFPSDSEQTRPMEPEDKPRKRRRSRRPERDAEDKERTSKSRPKTSTERRGEGSDSRRQSRELREQDIKTEGEDDWDPTMYQTTGIPVDPVTPPPIRRRIPRPPEDHFEQPM